MKYKDSNLQHNIDRIKIYLFTKNVTVFFVGIREACATFIRCHFTVVRNNQKPNKFTFTRPYLDNISFIDNNYRQRKMVLELGARDLHCTQQDFVI